MRRRTAILIATAPVVAIGLLAVLAPPVVRATPRPDPAVVDGGRPDRNGETALYSGELGPDQPFEIATAEVATGRYTFRLLVAGRFSALGPGSLTCDVVEERSGIALSPPVSVTLDPADGWALERADVPLALPEMDLSVRCSTASRSFGRLEVLRAALTADRD